MCRTFLGFCLAGVACAGCSGIALNTKVANSPAARVEMARSVIPGSTTERELETRWGLPVQKIREGGQTAWVYRDMGFPPFLGMAIPKTGKSGRYVIVTFQYGIAVDVTTSDEIGCRATFSPRPPNYTFDNPTQVGLVGRCGDAKGDGSDEAELVPGPGSGLVEEDRYVGGGKGK